MNAENVLKKIGRGGGLFGALGVIISSFLYNVDGGERAVMFNRFGGGVSPRIFSEGTHFFVPWFQRPFIYDIRVKPKVINTTTGTKDLQMVNLSLRLLFRPCTEFLPRLHQNLGPDYDERVLPSIGNEILKAVVAKYDAESLLTQREKVSREIRESIMQRTKQFDIIMEDVAITHLTYGKEFEKAIEEKQVAEQDAERVKFVVQKAEYEKQAAIIKASGEAHAAEMISKAVSDSGWGMLDIRRLEGARDIFENLGKSKDVTFVHGNGQNFHIHV
ncbi:putative prohibitin [Cryptosporidium felis]|nr:putative prohibitin [Cryptosporidium felis]